MTNMHKQCPPSFRAKANLEAIRGKITCVELANA